MDVDTACLDANDNEIEALRLEIRRLKREVAHLTDLRENAYQTIRRLEERLQTQERLSPFGRDLYMTSSGRSCTAVAIASIADLRRSKFFMLVTTVPGARRFQERERSEHL